MLVASSCASRPSVTDAEEQEVSKEFWFSLRDAAARMNLPDRVHRYEKHAENPQPDCGLGS